MHQYQSFAIPHCSYFSACLCNLPIDLFLVSSAKDILKAFQNHPTYYVTQYSMWRHSPVVRNIMWYVLSVVSSYDKLGVVLCKTEVVLSLCHYVM